MQLLREFVIYFLDHSAVACM